MTRINPKKGLDSVDLGTLGLPDVPLLGMANHPVAVKPLPNHRHKGIMEIHYLKMGEQIFTVAGQDYKIKSGDIFITWPPDIHSTGRVPHGKNIWYWTHLHLPEKPRTFLGMGTKIAGPLIYELWNLPSRHFRANKRVETLYKEIFTLAKTNSPTTPANIASRYLLWMLTIIECSKRSTSITLSSDIQQLVEIIEKNPEKNFPIQFMANKAGLSISRLKAKFKEQVGLPPNEFILRNKIKFAHELLLTTNSSITEIAYKLGFSSSQYFATVFRRFLNTSPSEVRDTTPSHGRDL